MKNAIGVAVATAALLLAACTDDGDPTDEEGAGPPTVDFQAPTRDALAPGVKVGDQTSQYLWEVASRDQTVVAAGEDTSDNVTRPLVVFSADGGTTWERVELPNPAGHESLPVPSLYELAATASGFVAVGGDEDGSKFTWTSENGQDWVAHDPSDDTLTRRDSIYELAVSGGELMLLGTDGTPGGGRPYNPVLWTSDDGQDWQRHDLADEGVDGYVGTLDPVEIARIDDELVLVANLEDPTARTQPNRITLWRGSSDATRFERETLPLDFAGGYRAYAQDLEVEKGRMFIAASGDVGDESETSSWEAVVMEERRDAWVKHPVLAGPTEEHPSTLTRSAGRWTLTGSKDGVDAAVASGATLKAMRERDHSTLTGPRGQVVSATTTVGETTVTVGHTDRSGVSEPMVWLARGNSVKPAQLPDDASGGRPSSNPSAAALSEGDVSVLGTVAGSPVAWTDEDGWTARGLPGLEESVDTIAVTDITTLSNDDLLAVGRIRKATSGEIGVWVQNAGSDSWYDVDEEAFAKDAESGYGVLDGSDIAATPRGVVIVATGSADGAQEVYAASSPAGGNAWRASRGAGRTTLDPSEQFVGRTPYEDFRAPRGGTIEMRTVVGSGRTFVAGGLRGEQGERTRGWTWRSTDAGRTWAKGRPLPDPGGSFYAAADAGATRGETMVLLGQAGEGADADSFGLVSWWSDDDGKSWTAGEPIHESASVNDVIATPEGFVALGATDADGDTTAAMWSSDDGRGWEQVDLAGEQYSGPGAQSLVTGVVHDGELVVIGQNAPPDGGGHYEQTLPLP